MSRHRVALIVVAVLCLSACSQKSGAPSQASTPANPSPSPALPSPTSCLNAFRPRMEPRTPQPICGLTVELPGGRRDQLEFRLQRKFSADAVSTFLQVTAREKRPTRRSWRSSDRARPRATSYLAGLKKLAKLSSSSTITFQETKVTIQSCLRSNSASMQVAKESARPKAASQW